MMPDGYFDNSEIHLLLIEDKEGVTSPCSKRQGPEVRGLVPDVPTSCQVQRNMKKSFIEKPRHACESEIPDHF